MDKKECLENREREFKTTIKLLKGYPANKEDLKPSAKGASIRQLVRTFYYEEVLLQKLLKNEPLGSTPPSEPPAIAQTIKDYEHEFKKTNDLIKGMSEEDLDKTSTFYIAPKTTGEVPKRQLVLFFLFDAIHHRGQLSVYLRVAGANVPSIYGPSADEPWT